MNIYLSTWLCRRPTNLWLTWSSSTCCWRTVSDIPWRRSSRPWPRKPWRQDASDTASVGARWGQGCYHIWRQSQPASRLELATDLDTWKYGISCITSIWTRSIVTVRAGWLRVQIAKAIAITYESINSIQSWSATWPRIWLQLTSFARPRCETPHRLQCIWTLYIIYWFEHPTKSNAMEKAPPCSPKSNQIIDNRERKVNWWWCWVIWLSFHGVESTRRTPTILMMKPQKVSNLIKMHWNTFYGKFKFYPDPTSLLTDVEVRIRIFLII